MNKEQREKASKDQTERLIYSYYTQWRYAKILINEKVLLSKYDFLKSIAKETQQSDSNNEEALIAQELTNGLMFDSLANCVQYIEDLFALIKAAKQKDFFIRNIITYSAGEIENFIKKEFTDKELCAMFYFPFFQAPQNENFKKDYTHGLNELKKQVKELKEFYMAYRFFYVQYKHGLTIALRPYANFDSTLIEKDKQNTKGTHLVAFDNLSIKKASRTANRFQNYVLIPNLSENIKPFLNTLLEEDNLLRFVTAPPSTDIEKFKEVALTVRQCMHLLLTNFLNTMRDGNPIMLRLPFDRDKVFDFSFPKVELPKGKPT